MKQILYEIKNQSWVKPCFRSRSRELPNTSWGTKELRRKIILGMQEATCIGPTFTGSSRTKK